MATSTTDRILRKRLRLLVAVRDRTVDAAVSAADFGAYVRIDTALFNRLMHAIDRLMEFEQQNGL